jgi:CxxC motif-containing protein (DUF1111 family)
MSPRRWLRLALAGVVASACGDNLESDDRQGGAATVDDRTREAYRQPAPNLSNAERARFQLGRSPFDFRWAPPKLGPLFNNISCVGCHGANGRGLSQIGMGPASQALVRVSLLEGEPSAPGGPVAVPGFGLQLQDHAVVGLPEVRVTLTWVETGVAYGDGEIVALREPRLDVRTPDGGFLPPSTRISYRIGQPTFGLGLLEAIPEDTLRALEDPDDSDGDGISGRINRVWDPEVQATVIGRFGWKANTSTLHLQVAAAFENDIGLSSIVFPEAGGFRDLNDDQLEDTTFFMTAGAVPAAGPRSIDAHGGRALFRDFGCAGCHTPTLVTGDHSVAAVAHQTIHPYTDLLVHDVGDRLSDGRPDFMAEGTEWRTPALWGIGLAKVVSPNATFLHDGRALTLEEAILWHGGEADQAKEAFRTADRADRRRLVEFLESL